MTHCTQASRPGARPRLAVVIGRLPLGRDIDIILLLAMAAISPSPHRPILPRRHDGRIFDYMGTMMVNGW